MSEESSGAGFSGMGEKWASRREFSEPSVALPAITVKMSAPALSREGVASEHAGEL